MPSGYDKCPDYGGPPLRHWTTFVAAIVVALLVAGVWWVKRG